MTRARPRNNFDLLRLAAAAQVVQYHLLLAFHLRLWGPLQAVVDAFPGVPVFFVMSGFLLTSSLIRSPDLASYARNRALRIYPALWVCFFVTVIAILIGGAISARFLLTPRGLGWIGGQLVIASGTPTPVRAFGTGTPNPSLWTIGVELQFYVILGLVFALCSSSRRRLMATLVFLGAASAVSALVVGWADQQGMASFVRLGNATAAPHFWLFALGAVMCLSWSRLGTVMAHPVVWSVAALALSLVVNQGPRSPLYVAVAILPQFAVLAVAVLSVAHARDGRPTRVLGGVDISYGLYLYHFVMLNCLAEFGWGTGWQGVLLVAGLSVLSAFLSYFLVERPALTFKKRSVRIPA